jgi:hypothetical protein
MKKRMEEQPKRVIPAFATEAEEAEWWYKNRNIHGKQLLAAVKSGKAQVLTKEKLRERIAASKKTPDQRNQTTTSRDAAHADPFTPLGRPRY